MAVVRLRLVSVDSVCRVAGWASHALAVRERQPPSLFIFEDVLVSAAHADDAVLAPALEAMSHPLDLVHKLAVVVSDAADGLLVHVLDPLDVLLVLQLRQIQEGEQDLARHDAPAPFRCLAAHDVHRYLLPVLEHLLDRKRDIRLDAVDAGLVPALGGEDDAGVLLDVADRAEGVWDGDELGGSGFVLSHRLVQLRVDRGHLVPLLLPSVAVDAVSDGGGEVVRLELEILVVVPVVLGARGSAVVHEGHLFLALLVLGDVLLNASVLLLVLHHDLVVVVVVLGVLAKDIVGLLVFSSGHRALLLLLQLSLEHLGVEEVSLVLEQIKDDVLAVALAVSFRDEPVLLVLAAAVRAQTQRLLVDELLLFAGQEEALTRELGNRMDQANTMVDVVAV